MFHDDKQKFEVSVAGGNVTMENILVYYVDEKAPTFTMQKLTGGIIAVIVVVSLIVLAGLLVLVSVCVYIEFPPPFLNVHTCLTVPLISVLHCTATEGPVQ